MYGKIFAAAAAMTLGMSSSASASEFLSVDPLMNPVLGTATNNTRMTNMSHRLDRFMERQNALRDSRLYVSRDNGERLAVNQSAGTYRGSR